MKIWYPDKKGFKSERLIAKKNVSKRMNQTTGL